MTRHTVIQLTEGLTVGALNEFANVTMDNVPFTTVDPLVECTPTPADRPVSLPLLQSRLDDSRLEVRVRYSADVDPATIRAEDRTLVLRQAIALTMTKAHDGLGALRTRFGDAMTDHAHAEAFDFLTRAPGEGDVPFAELPRLLANVDGVEALRDSYRRALDEGAED